MNQREFIKGLFVKKSNNDTFINIGVKKQEFLDHIETLKTDEKGFINLTMASQKNDPSKYSVWVNDWKPTKRQEPKHETVNENDLPF